MSLKSHLFLLISGKFLVKLLLFKYFNVLSHVFLVGNFVALPRSFEPFDRVARTTLGPNA